MPNPLAVRVAARYIAREFPSERALKNYLKDHPQADRSKHTVSEGEEKSKKDEKKPSLKERLTAVLKKVPEAAKKFVEDEGYRRKQLQGAAKAMEKAPGRVVQNVIKHVKKDAQEFKDAGAGVKAALKGEKLSDVQKKAIKSVARNLAIEVTIAALTGGVASLASRTTLSFTKTIATKVVYNAITDDIGDVLSNLDYAKDLTKGVFNVVMKLGAEPDPIEVLTYVVAAKVTKELENLSTEDILSALEE